MVSDLLLTTFLSIQAIVKNQRNECAGSIYSDGTYSLFWGNIDRVKVSSDGVLLWHYHSDGNLFLSLQDWLCFFYSKADTVALFADNRILVIKKNNDCKRLRELLEIEAAAFKGYPSVIKFRFINTIESFFSINLSEQAEDKLIDCFKIYYEIIEV